MSKPLKILHLEDISSDVEMLARELNKSGLACEIVHVHERNDFIKALHTFLPDIILSDHSLPSFDSHDALKIVKELGLDIPFILVTATVSEEYAVNIIKDGASDYILKDRLQRLPSAINAAVEKYKLEQEGKQADERIRASERKYKLLFESNPMPMWMLSKITLDIIAVNEAAVRHYGYTKEEFLNLNARDLRPKEDVPKYEAYLQTGVTGTDRTTVWRHKKKDGEIILIEVIAHDFMYENQPARIVLANDVTEKLKAEAEVTQQQVLQQKLITEVSMKVQERERDMIGKELHDNINQILATAKLYVDLGKSRNGEGEELLEKSGEFISMAISEIRKLSHKLVSPSNGNISLIKSTIELLDDIKETTSLNLQFAADDYEENKVDKNINLMFFRIIQEQMNNILKHAQAKHVTIKLDITEENIILSIEDDGIGFDPQKVSEGIGLRNINNRVGFYDGNMKIKSAPGQGCVLEVRVPVHVSVPA